MALFSTSIQHCMSVCVCRGALGEFRVHIAIMSTDEWPPQPNIIQAVQLYIHTCEYGIVLMLDTSLSVVCLNYLVCSLPAVSVSGLEISL